MKILATSDIHCNLNRLKKIKYKEADILIVAGDLTNIGLKIELKEVLDKISSFTHINTKIVVLGNHDSRNHHNKNGMTEERTYEWCKMNYPEIIFLNNEIVDIDGLKIYGTPWNSGYKGLWSYEYNLDNRKDLTCPKENVDIIITHEPPSSYELSYIDVYGDLGNIDLRNYLEENKCKILISGHIHENKNKSVDINGCMCYNVSESVTEIAF
ncbi:MAG: metallophosphoesterase family protein [Clostridium chrysemydis]|uniref:metallophosphoesterase family protein n=1 Tax=Clostridium chrysemydis TaxID=2665504 RepID=UPI003F3A0A98